MVGVQDRELPEEVAGQAVTDRTRTGDPEDADLLEVDDEGYLLEHGPGMVPTAPVDLDGGRQRAEAEA